LLALESVVVTPHAASATCTTRAAMVDRAVDNVLAVLHGRPAPDAVR
jgi:lactate dehydrogenase-like 2-hydroxyacid dehydrogenase